MTVAHEVDPSAPELPRLADVDIKAVRALLPGKMLGRTAALLGAALTVLSSLGALSKEVQEVLGIALEPWVLALVATGSAVVVAIQIGVEAWTAQVRRRTQDLAVKAEVVPSGYFRIGPYSSSQEDRESFRRADRIHERVFDWLLCTEATPLYLTGDSGSGKSSLLSAFVLPSLRARGWTIAEARAWQDPVAALREALALLGATSHRRTGTGGEQPPDADLRRLIAAAARRAATRSQTERTVNPPEPPPGFAVVLDQFEEFLVLHTPEQREGFLALLAALRERPVVGLRVLLVLRSDYQTSLDELGVPPLRQGENWMQVGRFTLSAAGTFLIRSGLGLRKQALERILHSAAEMDDTPGMVRPITLNVVGYVLASGGASAPSLDAGVLVRRYIEEAVEQPAIRDYAPPVLERMITEQGTKQPRSERELVEATKLRPAEVRAALNGLHTAALARPLDRERAIWELSHDFIARAAARYLGRRSFRSRERLLGYVAPALLSIVLATAAGAVAWQSGAEDRAIARLALLGLAASPREEGGLRLEESSSLNQTSFEKVQPVLTTLSDQIRAVRINNHNNRNGNPIEDLAPIGQLVQLRSLELANTEVHKYDVLKNLSTLENLDLSHTPIADVSPLSGLANLKTLNLSGAPIADISPIAGLIGLEELHLEGTRIRDLTPLAQLTALRKLTLPPGVDDLRSLAGMVALQELNLARQQGVEDLSPLAGLTRLVELHLEGTQVKSLLPLARLTSLRKLSLPSGITDLGPLAGMVGLEELDLSNQQVHDLAPLSQMTALKTLNLARQKVEDLSPLGGYTRWLV
jgi:Leucine-rich repeat (LRR) protein